MRKPILVLQYPNSHEGRTVAIAATRDPIALKTFKGAVLEEAKLAVMDWETDEVLCMYIVSESGPNRAFEVTDTLEATALLPGDSIIVLSFC
jgi:Flp pilus assembly protein CpaB